MSGMTFMALLGIAGGLFATGLFGVLARRTVLFQLISLEIMLGGPALAFIASGSFHGDAQGQGMFVLILVLAAAEVALGLALYLALRRVAGTDDSDALNRLRR
jgi:NADH-quinone oxidoreductase subunit K